MSTHDANHTQPRRRSLSYPRGPLGERLQTRRLERGLTLSQLSQLCGVHAQTLSLLERGRRLPTSAMLTAIAQALHVMPAWLLGRDPGTPDEPVWPASLRTTRPTSTMLGHRLRSLRQAQGLTQVQLAARVGVTPSVISRIETGLTTAPSMSTMVAISQALAVAPSWLVGADPDAPTAR